MSSMAIVTRGSSRRSRAILRTTPRPGMRLCVSRSGPSQEADQELFGDLGRPSAGPATGRALQELINDAFWDDIIDVQTSGTIDARSITSGTEATMTQSSERAAEPAALPQFETFQYLHDNCAVAGPNAAARAAWRIVADRSQSHGSVIDIRGA